MRQHSRVRSAIIVVTALGLSFWLTACGGDDSSSANSPGNSSDSGQADEPKEASNGGLDVPDDVPDFPVPDKYTVKVGADSGEAWTAVLGDIPGGWEETKSFYQEELVKAGWALGGDRPFAGKDGTELDATKADMTVTVAITFINESTGVAINLVRG